MWVSHNGKLVHMKDASRHRYKTYIKEDVLANLKELAAAHHTEVGYLLENGVMHLLEEDTLTLPKQPRCAKKEFRTTMDAALFNTLTARAKQLGVPINRLLQEAVHYIDIGTVKRKDYRYRIESLK